MPPKPAAKQAALAAAAKKPAGGAEPVQEVRAGGPCQEVHFA
jgi:hypothetical protein